MFCRSVISSLKHGYTRHQEAVQEEILGHRLSKTRLQLTRLRHVHQLVVPADELTLHKNLRNSRPSSRLRKISHHRRIVADIDRLEWEMILFQESNRILAIRTSINGKSDDGCFTMTRHGSLYHERHPRTPLNSHPAASEGYFRCFLDPLRTEV